MAPRRLLIAGLVLAPLAACVRAPPASAPQRLRRAALARDATKVRSLAEALTPSDVPAVLALLDELTARPKGEVVSFREGTPRSSEIADAMRRESDWLEPCFALLGRHGDAGAAGSIVALVAAGGQETAWIWGPAAQAVADIAGRVPLQPEALDPMTTSADEEIAALGRLLEDLLFAASPVVPEDPETFVGACRWATEQLRQAAGGGEALARIEALERLERLDSRAAAARYVDELAAAEPWTSSCAEAGLWRLTGRHASLSATASVRDLGGAVTVIPHAVARWRAWLSDPADAPPRPPSAEELARIDRLVELMPGPLAGTSEPPGTLVRELLASDDPKLRSAIVRALVDRVLPDAEIDRLIAASERPRSPAQALAARQVLFHAGTTAARAHLQRRLATPGADADAAGLVASVLTIRSGDVPLLAALSTGAGREVRRAIGDVVRRPENWPRMEEDARDPLVAVLLEHPADDEDFVAALDFAFRRHGKAAELAERALDRRRETGEPELRERLARLRVSRQAESGLEAMLGAGATEAEALAALDAYRRSLPQATGTRIADARARASAAFALRRSAASSEFESVRRASASLLDELRGRALQEMVAGLESGTRALLESARSRGDDEAAEQAREGLAEGLAPSVLARHLDELESTYGPLPDRSAALRDLESAVARARAGGEGWP